MFLNYQHFQIVYKKAVVHRVTTSGTTSDKE